MSRDVHHDAGGTSTTTRPTATEAVTWTVEWETVESHVSAVLRKLQLSNRYQLTNWASERRLL